ncbi:MAG: gluconate 2-dehydrogenase subunit 3 family protein [Parahaliea sp.]
MSNSLSRRNFVQLGTAFGTALLVFAQSPRPLAAAAAAVSGNPEAFDQAQWASVEAITACIVPTDHEPGALEANCVNFIDKVLVREDAALLPLYQAAITALDKEAQLHFGRSFANADENERNQLLELFEANKVSHWPDTLAINPQQFLQTVIVHTLMGFLASPEYGGNRQYSGWKVVGYPGPEHHMGGYSRAQVEGRAAVLPVWAVKRES